MTTDKKALIGIFVLVFPILVLGGLWAKAISGQHIGEQVWKVKIKGYDPRDLLYGHYLRYRVDWNMGSQNTPHPHSMRQDICMCLNATDNSFKNPIATPTQCTAQATKSCQSVVKVYRHGSRYALQRSSEPEKYFIPEENAQKVDRLFREGKVEFYMEVMAHKDKSVSIRGLYVDDTKLETYLRGLRN